jgi:hypothetical protein
MITATNTLKETLVKPRKIVHTDKTLPVYYLLREDGLTHQDVADAAGVSAGTVANVLKRGIRNQKVEDTLKHHYSHLTSKQIFGEDRS